MKGLAYDPDATDWALSDPWRDFSYHHVDGTKPKHVPWSAEEMKRRADKQREEEIAEWLAAEDIEGSAALGRWHRDFGK